MRFSISIDVALRLAVMALLGTAFADSAATRPPMLHRRSRSIRTIPSTSCFAASRWR